MAEVRITIEDTPAGIGVSAVRDPDNCENTTAVTVAAWVLFVLEQHLKDFVTDDQPKDTAEASSDDFSD